MRDIFVLTFVLGLIPFVAVKPYVGALLWAWISYMNPHRLSWGFLFDFQLAMVVGGATILAWLLSRERKIPPGDPVTMLIIALCVWVSITTLFAVAPDEAYRIWERTLKIMGMTVITIMLVTTRERLHALIWCIVVSVGYFGVKGGLFTVVTGSRYLVLGPPDSFLADNNSMSLVLIMIVPLMRYLQLHSPVLWIRLGLYASILLTMLAIIGSHSRGALLGGSAMLMLLVVKSRRRGLILVAGLAAAVFALAFTPDRWIDRMKSIAAYEQDESAQGRFDSWRYAFRLSLDRPVVGGGFVAYDDAELFLSYVPEAPRARSWHSIFFEMLGEHGWTGLLLFMALLIAALIMARGIRRRTRSLPDYGWAADLAAMCQVSIAGYLVTGLFQDHAFFDLYFHVLALIAVTYGIVQKETAAAHAPVKAGERKAFTMGGRVRDGRSMSSVSSRRSE